MEGEGEGEDTEEESDESSYGNTVYSDSVIRSPSPKPYSPKSTSVRYRKQIPTAAPNDDDEYFNFSDKHTPKKKRKPDFISDDASVSTSASLPLYSDVYTSEPVISSIGKSQSIPLSEAPSDYYQPSDS